MVGARGFEPPASRSRTVRSTKLSYAPTVADGAPAATPREGGRGTREGRRIAPRAWTVKAAPAARSNGPGKRAPRTPRAQMVKVKVSLPPVARLEVTGVGLMVFTRVPLELKTSIVGVTT
jgi:hypothetical protein